MKKKSSFIIFIMIGMLTQTLCFAQKSNKQLRYLKKDINSTFFSGNGTYSKKKATYVEGEVIVVLKEGFSSSMISSLMQMMGLTTKKTFGFLSQQGKGTHMVVSGNKSTNELIKMLKANENVESASPNYIKYLDAMPNDPKIDKQWAVHNIGDTINHKNGIDDADIDAPEAWDKQTNSSTAVVAIIDSGVNYKHEDLSANMWINEAEATGEAGVDDDENGFIDDIYGYDFASDEGDDDSDPLDMDGHGTHVAGIIGAKGDNGIGITGVNWDVKIMALKVFPLNSGAAQSDILDALSYVLKMKKEFGVNIVAVNASYGGGGFDQSTKDAIKLLGDNGVIFVAAAGNSESDNDKNAHFPSSYDLNNIIAVAASDQNDSLAYFSSYGKNHVDIAAPGENILSTVPGSREFLDHDIFYDDVESSSQNNKWEHSGNEDKWAVTEEEANSYAHAWSDSPNGNYVEYTNATLTYTEDIDLSAYTDQQIGIGADMKYAMHRWNGTLSIEASGDSGESWKWLTKVDGYSPKNAEDVWSSHAGLIPKELKTANFRMRFRFDADGGHLDDGIYIDNIAIGIVTNPKGYTYYSGTSMATPYVTGSVALMAAQYPEENEITRISRILSGGDKKSSLQGKVLTGARLNIKNSLAEDLDFRSMIKDINQTIGVYPADVITILGSKFGEGQGNVYFYNDINNKVQADIVSWSDSSIKVIVPSNSGKYISISKASGTDSLNDIQVTAWEKIASTIHYYAMVKDGNDVTNHEIISYDGAISHDGKIYIFGMDLHYVSDNIAEVYDPVNGDSVDISVPDSDTFNFRDCTTAVLEDEIYIANYTSDVAAYNPANANWNHSIASLPNDIRNGQLITASGTLYYVGGELDRDTPIKSLYAYNKVDNTWIAKKNLNIERTEHSAVVYQGKIYVMGGKSSDKWAQKSVEVYDPENDTWTSKADLPVSLKSATATATPEGIMIMDGDSLNASGRTTSEALFYYNESEDTWVEKKGLTEFSKDALISSLVFVEDKGSFLILDKSIYFLDISKLASYITPPQKPSDVVFTNITNTDVTINWQDNSDNEDGFKIYRNNVLIYTTGENVTSYHDSGLNSQTTYNYTIKATKGY